MSDLGLDPIDDNLFAVADSLGCTVERAGNTLLVQTKKFVRFGEQSISSPGFSQTTTVEVPVSIRAVSSFFVGDDVLVWLRGPGNLSFLVVTNYAPEHPVSLFVMDLAKMMMKPEGYLEILKPRTVQEPVSALAHVVARTYHKGPDHKWTQAP